MLNCVSKMSAFVILLLFLIFLLYDRFSRRARLIRRIPGPCSWPIIGNITNFILPPDKLFSYNRSLLGKYGNISQIHGLNTYLVRISRPSDIQELFSTTSNKKFPYNLVSCWLQNGLLLSNGKKWHQRRKLLTKAFHFNILKRFSSTFVEETDTLLKRVQYEATKDRTDLMPIISDVALRILCETAMGLHINTQSSIESYQKTLQILGNCFSKRLSKAWYRIDFLFRFSSLAKAQNKAIAEVHALTNNVINNRRENYGGKVKPFEELSEKYESNEKLAMLDLLLKYEEEGEINNEGIKEEVNTFLFAGHDTTATAMKFMIMALANEPDVQDKIYEELRLIFGDSKRSPTIQDLSEMKYLECCIKESLRLYPSVPIIARHLDKDTKLGGYIVPANTTCIVSIFDLHRRADVYSEPERFIPERFLPENCFKRHLYAHLSFSFGSRNCIGQKFAMLQMKTVISGLLRNFRLQPITKPKDLIFRTDLVLSTTHPIYAKFCSR